MKGTGEDSRGDAISRRSVSLLLTSVGAFLTVDGIWSLSRERLAAFAAPVSKVVRLEDVQNRQIQEALRAAVSGDLLQAEQLFSSLIETTPSSASMWSNRGSVRLSLQDFEAAKEDFTRAIELAPEAPVPFLNRAIANEALGLYAEAVADCKAAIANDPEEYAAHFNLGNVHMRVGDYADALAAFSQAANLAPGVAGYRLKEALALYQLDRVKEAESLMKGLVRKYPNYAEAQAALAALLWQQGQASGAEEHFFDAVSLLSNFSDIRWVRQQLQWPPKMISSFSDFLLIQ